jgi:proteic killer suppression protein
MSLDVIGARRYYDGMIRDFADKHTERLFRRERVKKFARQVQRAALRKLVLLDAAESLDDLRVPPGNRLEKRAGDREGQHSIRINDPWRLCFRWSDGEAHAVEITDYH